MRLIAIRRSEAAAAEARRKARRQAQQDGYQISQQTFAAADWFILVTSLKAADFAPDDMLAPYRLRRRVDIDQAWRLSRISGVAVGLCKRRRPAVPWSRRRSDSLQCDDRVRIGLHQFSRTNAGLHHAAV
jgi:hypothetical protein